jgi:hypothetical protein
MAKHPHHAAPMSGPVKLFDASAGYEPVANLMAAGDPDVHWIDDRWWMFFGAAHTDEKVNLFSASLPPGAPITSTDWTITTDPADPSRAVPLVAHPAAGRFNEWLHTPSYVRGVEPRTGATIERIYYTASRARTGRGGAMDREFTIGALERSATGWRPLDKPVLVGTTQRPQVLEPKAGYWDGRWRIWYMNTPKAVDESVQPDNRIEYVESEDGLGGWSPPVVLLDDDLHHHDAAVARVNDVYVMVVASAPNLYDEPDYPPQGLWLLTSRTPSGDRADWTAEPLPILTGDGAPEWYAGAIYSPFIVAGNDAVHVFFTGARRPGPDPYVLSIGRLDLPSTALPSAPSRHSEVS